MEATNSFAICNDTPHLLTLTAKLLCICKAWHVVRQWASWLFGKSCFVSGGNNVTDCSGKLNGAGATLLVLLLYVIPRCFLNPWSEKSPLRVSNGTNLQTILKIVLNVSIHRVKMQFLYERCSGKEKPHNQ